LLKSVAKTRAVSTALDRTHFELSASKYRCFVKALDQSLKGKSAVALWRLLERKAQWEK
jgi:uncharacterized protein (DUF1778 family)